MANAVAVTDDTFQSEVLDSSIPVLVDFWAVWCGPCRLIAPALDEIALEYKDRLKVVKVDVDASPEISMRYRIQSIPTLMVFKGGKDVERVIGALPKNAILSKLKPHL